VLLPEIPHEYEQTDYHNQQFRVMFLNNLRDSDLSIDLYMDGEVVNKTYLRAGQPGRVLGIYNGSTAVLPFKFQELELVGTFSG
jgi:hypothetical protein